MPVRKCPYCHDKKAIIYQTMLRDKNNFMEPYEYIAVNIYEDEHELDVEGYRYGHGAYIISKSILGKAEN